MKFSRGDAWGHKFTPVATEAHVYAMITVNGKDQEQYFARPVLRMVIEQPLIEADRRTEFDVICTVKGSGLSGQAGAVRHGIARALVNYEPGLRSVLKPFGYLTRDPRTVERKKYGRAKARRGGAAPRASCIPPDAGEVSR